MLAHPLGARDKMGTLKRFVRWQTGSRLLKQSSAMPFVNGTRLLVRTGMRGATGNLYVGLMEFEDMAFALHLLRPGDDFIDVGANVGVYTILASSAGARVLALEPVPETFQQLLDNIYLNRFLDQVRAMNMGAASDAAELTFTADEGAMDHVVTSADKSQSTVTIQVDALDVLAEGMSPVMLKIDVEGFEFEVIRGAGRVLGCESLLAVLIEFEGFSARYGLSDADVHDALLEYGFVPAQYDPFDRKLGRRDGYSTSGNTLYVRMSSVLDKRLGEATPFSVLDLQI
jgi:FkbM family methyltransferase